MTVAPASAVPVPEEPVSIWPVPVRVMAWTPDGVAQLGVLPDAPPAALPNSGWYVEPTRKLDEETFRKLVDAVRAEHVPGLSLRGQAIARWVDALADLPALDALVLDDTDVADPAAIALTLHRVYLARTAIDDAAVTRLVAAQPALEVLSLEDCAVGDRSAQSIAKLGGLAALNLSGTRLTDAGGAALGALAHLQILDLGRTSVAAKTIAAIRPLALRELFLDETHVGREIATLAGHAPGLVRFDSSSLVGFKPADADVAWLANAPNLVEVGLSGAAVHDELVLRILALPKLRDLRLAQAPITTKAIHEIAKLSALEQVDLAETPVDDETAAALIALPHMRSLRLDHTLIGDTALHATPSPALEELFVSHTQVGDAGTKLLEATPNLVALGLGETQVGDATIARIAQLPKLRTLVLSVARAKREALPALGALTDLERLYLDETHADDTTVAALAPLRELRVLHLQGTDVSDASLPTLRAFEHLEELTIGDTRVDAAVVQTGAWPHLRTLSLLGLPIGDAALSDLRTHASLVALDLSSTDITNPAPIGTLPRLRILGLVATKLSHDGIAAADAIAARRILVIR